MATDKQRNAWQLTINNFQEKNIDHTSVKDILVTKFATLQYFCMADEVGANGTPHMHIYLYCTSRVRFSMVKKYFPEAHIEDAKASVEANIEYIRKTGKWADTDKAETSLEGTFEEWGEKPIQKGSNMAMQELYNLIKDGYTNAQILEINNDYIMDIDKLDKVRTTLLIEEFKNKRRLDLKVIYISGATGTGKTRGVLDEHGDGSVYRVSDYTHPFDSYNCQSVIAFDEFRSGIRIGDILQYADIYPVELPARYANKYACYNIVYIISNWPLEEQYKEVQITSPESWNAFLRRIHEVRIYNSDGTIEVYDSVDKYYKEKVRKHIQPQRISDEIFGELMKV